MKLETSFDYVDAALLHRSPRCVVLVNPGSHVEKKEQTVFVKGVEGKTRMRRVVDSTQIWELVDDGIDMWEVVSGICMMPWRKLGFTSRGTTVQATTARHSGSVDELFVWAGKGGYTKARCFRCGNPRNHDPRAHVLVIGPTGRPPQRTLSHEPDFPAKWSPEQDFGSMGQGKIDNFFKEDVNFLDPLFSLSRVSFQGAGRRILKFCRFLRDACGLGMALLLDARTMLRSQGTGFFWYFWCWTQRD